MASSGATRPDSWGPSEDTTPPDAAGPDRFNESRGRKRAASASPVLRREFRATLPLHLLVQRILPHVPETTEQALSLMLVCVDVWRAAQQREFWEPLLTRVRNARVAWMRAHGLPQLARVVQLQYHMWPSSFPDIIATVRSKFEFEDCPPGFPHARIMVRQADQARYAVSAKKFEASALIVDDGDDDGDGTLYRESCASTQYRGIFLQPCCVYRARTGFAMTTLGGRHLRVEFPSGVSFDGNKSSRTTPWTRLGNWTIESKCAEFCFKGDFRRVDRSTTSTVLCETMSDAIGSATLRGAALDGPVHAFNLAGEVDCFVKRMAFATSGGAVYALDVTTGAVALLEKADLQAARDMLREIESRRLRKTSKRALKLHDLDYERQDTAAFVCLRPEGVFSCAELVRDFGDAAKEAIAELEERRDIPVEVEELLAERASPAGVQYLVRWEGYPDAFNTWELKSNLGDDASVLIDDFRECLPMKDE